MTLDQLVTRHRALALHDEHIELHAELIAAEVAHQLAMTRSALRRHPAVRRASLPHPERPGPCDHPGRGPGLSPSPQGLTAGRGDRRGRRPVAA